MINLLPPLYHRQLIASRTNALLVRYVMLSLILIVVMIAEMSAVYLFLSNSKAQSEAVISENDQKAAKYSEVQKQAEQFRTDLVTAKTILDKQVPYTKIFRMVADLMPDGVILNHLTINPSTFGTPTNLDIRARTYQAAIAFHTTLNNSNVLSNVSFQTVSFDSQDTTGYPYSSTLSVTFKKEALVGEID
ncbi:MAG: PilN domain-containing protein [Candidatus Saccharimonas aalborgensis]